MARRDGDYQDYFDTIHGGSGVPGGDDDEMHSRMHADRGRHATEAEARARQAEVEGI